MPNNSASYLEMRQALWKFLTAELGEEPFAKILIGVSGGADSLALAKVLFDVKSEHPVIPVVIDHGLQSGSDQVALEAKKNLAKIGYEEICLLKINVTLLDGIESSARRARYQAFATALENYGANHFLLAHTLDDQAETTLMGLARGSGARSISGMSKINPPYYRPILDFTRKDTENICREFNLTFWEDPFNYDEKFLRAKIRKNLRPVLEETLGPKVYEALAKTAFLLQRDQEFINQHVVKLIAKFSADYRLPYKLALAEIDQLHPSVRIRVMRELLYKVGVPSGQLSIQHLLTVDDLVVDWHGQKGINLPGEITVLRAKGELIFQATVTR
jgi:tRNA(Ile)-lysidine synthase